MSVRKIIHYLIDFSSPFFKAAIFNRMGQIRKLRIKECPSLGFSKFIPHGKDTGTRKPGEGGGRGNSKRRADTVIVSELPLWAAGALVQQWTL